jgi:hypothetical protein
MADKGEGWLAEKRRCAAWIGGACEKCGTSDHSQISIHTNNEEKGETYIYT